MVDTETTEPTTAEERGTTRFVKRSSRRVAALERLQKGPARRAQVGAHRGVGAANATEVLDELHGRALVERLVADDEVAYGLTAAGELALFDVQQGGR